MNRPFTKQDRHMTNKHINILHITRTAKILKINHTKNWQRWEGTGTLILCWQECTNEWYNHFRKQKLFLKLFQKTISVLENMKN